MPARKRRAGRATEKAACAALRLRARSPAGIPLAAFANGTFVPRAQLRARLPEGGAERCGLCRTRRRRLQRCTSRAGPSAGRHDARAARTRTANPRAGTAISPRVQVCLENTTLGERDCGGYRHRRGKVKGVSISVDESKQFAARVFLQTHATPMIRIEKRPRSLTCHAPPTGKRAFTRGTHYCPKWPAR